MQDTASIGRPLRIHIRSLSTMKPSSRRQKKLSTLFPEKFKFSAILTFAKENLSRTLSQKAVRRHTSLERDYVKAENYLATIEDPLWKYVCYDIINMMGPASVLKIWDSTLGEVSPQAKDIEIYTQTKEASQFIEQYAFVILGSLQPYLPSLKQLSVKTVSTG